MSVSVIVPTRNRRRLLRELIDSLWQQTLGPDRFEIIIVDNLSTDGTPEMMAELVRISPCRMVYHVMDVNRGPAHSRNTGAALAFAEVLAFTDSDCRVEKDWLAKGIEALTGDLAFVTGSVLDKPEQKVTFFSRACMGVTWEHPSYPTCNIFYRRERFMEAGGFDVNLCFRDFRNRPVECADTDLAWRLKDKGCKNRFARDMTVYHEVETMRPVNWLMEPFRLFVVPALVRLHPELRGKLLQRGLFFSRTNGLFYAAAIGAALSVALHPAFLALALPQLCYAATAGKKDLSIRRIPRLAARTVLLTARQAVMCAGLIYGSLRFRSIVL